MGISLRRAVESDASRISELASQLGYTVSAEDIAATLAQHAHHSDSRVIVAVDGASVVGWTTFRIARHIHSDPAVEISGFVVDQEQRRRGIGKAMMAFVESWAIEEGTPRVRLNANIKRKEAHRFYEALGFKKIKEQIAFQKELQA
jgi:GNAT superfamily N-acetyltransferase